MKSKYTADISSPNVNYSSRSRFSSHKKLAQSIHKWHMRFDLKGLCIKVCQLIKRTEILLKNKPFNRFSYIIIFYLKHLVLQKVLLQINLYRKLRVFLWVDFLYIHRDYFKNFSKEKTWFFSLVKKYSKILPPRL